MTTVKVWCINCDRALTLPARDVDLLSVAGRVSYHFRCTLCGAHIQRDASPETVALLGKGGIRARAVTAPRPEIEGRPPEGPPISEDDLIAFGRDLYALP